MSRPPAPDVESNGNAPRDRALALACAVVGALVRLPHLGWGAPDILEEAYPLKKALEMWGWDRGSLQLDPRTVGWPSLSFYVHLLLQKIQYAIGHLTGAFADRYEYLVSQTADSTTLLLIARGVGVVAAAGIIYAGTRLATRLAGRRGGLLTGSLLIFSPLLLRFSQLVTPDILLAFCFAMALVALVDAGESGRMRDAVRFGIWIGLGASCKYTPALLAPLLVPALLMARRGRDGGERADASDLVRRLGAAALAAALAFAVTSPFFLAHLDVLRRDFGYQFAHLETGHFGVRGRDGWWYYVARVLAPGLGAPALALATAGLAIQAWRRRGAWLLLASACLLFWGVMGALGTRFDRYMLPLAMPLAVGLAAWVPLLDEARFLRGARARRTALALVAAIAIVPAARATRVYHLQKSGPGTQARAGEFLRARVDRDDVAIATEAYGPEIVDTDLAALRRRPVFGKLSPAEQRIVEAAARPRVDYIPMYAVHTEQAGFVYDLRHFLPYDYVVTSESVRGRYLAAPRRYPRQRIFYDDLERFTRRVAVFSRNSRSEGPEIRVYALTDSGRVALLHERGELDANAWVAWQDSLDAGRFFAFVETLARRNVEAQRWSAAAVDYGMLLQTTDDPGALIRLCERAAFTRLQAGDASGCLEASDRYLEEAPSDEPNAARVWAYRVEAFARLGRKEELRAAGDRLLELLDGDPTAEYWRARVDALLARPAGEDR